MSFARVNLVVKTASPSLECWLPKPRREELCAARDMEDGCDFDQYADHYDARVNQAIAVSGEDKDYFARGRIAWTRRYFNEDERIESVMDFGCGVGSSAPQLLQLPQVKSLLGVDVSRKSIE